MELQHVTDTGQKSDRQKVAMRPNGRLYKIILPAKGLSHNSDSDQQLLPRHHTNPISPPRERDA